MQNAPFPPHYYRQTVVLPAGEARTAAEWRDLDTGVRCHKPPQGRSPITDLFFLKLIAFQKKKRHVKNMIRNANGVTRREVKQN